MKSNKQCEDCGTDKDVSTYVLIGGDYKEMCEVCFWNYINKKKKKRIIDER